MLNSVSNIALPAREFEGTVQEEMVMLLCQIRHGVATIKELVEKLE
ncbi:MAG: hypothetical protein ACOC38_05295 [Promethearchaeia archaeon]